MWEVRNIFNFLWVCVWWFKNNPATLHSQTTAEGLWERERVKGLSKNRIRFVHKDGRICKSSLRHW
jgi:hypothetical protein